jgi:predicted TIM-barrel fold metal-dependent hydrolase
MRKNEKRMEIELFDGHTHIGSDYYSKIKGFSNRTVGVEELLRTMDNYYVSKSIVIPMVTTPSIVCPNSKFCNNYNNPPVLIRQTDKSYFLRCPVCGRIWEVKRNPYEKKNYLLFKAVKDHKEKLIPFPVIDPRYPKSSDYLKELLTKYEIIGIKIHLVATFYNPERLINSDLMDVIKENNLCILFDPFQFKFSREILKLASYYPSVKFIIAHCAGLDEKILMGIRNSTNVYVDTSAIVQYYDKSSYRGISREVDSAQTAYNILLENAGANKIIFGTDFPILNYQKQIEDFRSLNFEKSILEKIGFKNLERLL